MPTMFGYYEGGIFHKPPLEKLDSKEWAKKMHKAGKKVEVGEYSISSGKWRFSEYIPPKKSGGRKRAVSKDIIMQILTATFPKGTTYKRSAKQVAEITKINELKTISVSKLLNTTYADYVAEWSRENGINISTYRSGRWQK